jgi:hypothetical protein
MVRCLLLRESEWWLEVLLRMCLSGCSPNTFGLDDNREVGQVAGDGERWLDQTTRRLATARPTSWPGHQPGICSGIAGRVPALARPVMAAVQPLLFLLRRRGASLEEPCSYCSHRPLRARAELIAFRARAGSQTPIRYMCASGGDLAVILPSLLPFDFPHRAHFSRLVERCVVASDGEVDRHEDESAYGAHKLDPISEH